MKVLLDLQYLNIATTGIKTYMVELAKAIRKYPHPDLEFIFTHEPEEQSKKDTFKNPQSKIQRLNYHLDYFRWKEFQLPDLVKKHQPDVLICPDFVSPAASLSCRRLTVIHDAFFWQMPQNYPKWWRTYFLSLLKKGLKEQTEIITTTDYSKRSLEKYLGKQWPISVIYQCPKSLKAASEPSIVKKLGLSEQSFYLHIGVFDKRKQLPFLTEAFGEALKQGHTSKKLVLVGGPGHSDQMNDLPKVEKLVQELGLEEHILLPGYLSDGEIKALYEHAYAYLFPSENEGFGIPIPEAMGFGLPVIHSDQQALVEVAGGAGIAFKTGEQEDLIAKITHLDAHPELRNELGQKGKKRSEDFTAQKFIESFYTIILQSSN